jgi:hypothetical protein
LNGDSTDREPQADRIGAAARPVKSEEHSMRNESRWLVLFVVVAVAPAVQADQLKMRTADPADVTLVPRKAPAVATQTPNPSGAAETVMVPAGTVLSVRLSQGIDVDSTQTGATFKARIDDPVMIDGRVVIPREAAVVIQVASVKQSGTLKGSDRIALKVNAISFNDRVYEVVTGFAVAQGKGEGRRTARKVGGGAGLGAIVGGIADGGEGAAIGAVVGGIAGAVVAASGEEHLKLPAETRLQFELSAAVLVQP